MDALSQLAYFILYLGKSRVIKINQFMDLRSRIKIGNKTKTFYKPNIAKFRRIRKLKKTLQQNIK